MPSFSSRAAICFGAAAASSPTSAPVSVMVRQIEVQDRVAGSFARNSTQGVFSTQAETAARLLFERWISSAGRRQYSALIPLLKQWYQRRVLPYRQSCVIVMLKDKFTSKASHRFVLT